MPIFMDLHITPGVTAKDVADAHLLDVKIQHNYRCKAMTYWVDEDKGTVFCLIEAPDKESVVSLHKKSHGMIPHEVILVDTNVVQAFFFFFKDPENAIAHADTQTKVFSEPAFRVILLTQTKDVRLMQNELGKERMNELQMLYATMVREQARNHQGREVILKEEGYAISFVSASQAIECALAIQKKLMTAAGQVGLRMGLHAGDPVNKSESIFGNTIRLAQSSAGLAEQIKLQCRR